MGGFSRRRKFVQKVIVVILKDSDRISYNGNKMNKIRQLIIIEVGGEFKEIQFLDFYKQMDKGFIIKVRYRFLILVYRKQSLEDIFEFEVTLVYMLYSKIFVFYIFLKDIIFER